MLLLVLYWARHTSEDELGWRRNVLYSLTWGISDSQSGCVKLISINLLVA